MLYVYVSYVMFVAVGDCTCCLLSSLIVTPIPDTVGWAGFCSVAVPVA